MPNAQPVSAPLADAAKYMIQALPGIAVFLLGVLLPTLTLITELGTGMSAAAFFDPIPTWLHIILVALVPLGNGLVWYALRTKKLTRPGPLLLLNGAVLGISGFYALVYLPITPIAIMVLWTGLALLPLAPAFSFVAAIIFRRHLMRSTTGHTLPRLQQSLWPGVALSLLLIIGIQLPTTLTQYGIKLAASDDAEQQRRGVRLLRNWGSDEEMLRACYRRSGRVPDMISFILSIGQRHVPPETVRSIFYRVTGKSFNTMPAPSVGRAGLWNPSDEFVFDGGRGGDQVGGRIKDLSLTSSVLDGSVDADAALGYLEWSFVVDNKGVLDQEARMQLALPPGATVSRVTLWVNGEPREASFAGRGKVRQAYESIVRQSRDPLLVTMSAPDTVLLQMFPVPAGGQMKARIGITVPLLLEDEATAILPLPYIRERNHDLGNGVKHRIWIESQQRMYAAYETGSAVRENGAYALRSTVTDSVLGHVAATIRFDRNASIRTVFTKDAKSQSYIRQTLHFDKHAFDHVIIVLDGSNAMRGYRHTIADLVDTLPTDTRFSVLIAGDGIETLSAPPMSHRQITQRIRAHDFIGGTDNIPALTVAWELASQQQNAVILWVHGPQPVLLSSIDLLHGRWQRRPDHPTLFDLSLDGGQNRIAERLVDIPAIRNVPRKGNLKDDLISQIKILTGQKARARIVRINRPAPLGSSASTKRTSDHLGRLWARDQVSRLTAGGKPRALRQAIKIAQRYQIVTPVSGAVVLETGEQYRRAGLEPMGADNVPTVPEPEEWAMIIVMLMMLIWLRLRHNRTTRMVA